MKVSFFNPGVMPIEKHSGENVFFFVGRFLQTYVALERFHPEDLQRGSEGMEGMGWGETLAKD